MENDYTESSIEVQETDGLREEILSPQILSQIFPEYKELILQNNKWGVIYDGTNYNIGSEY